MPWFLSHKGWAFPQSYIAHRLSSNCYSCVLLPIFENIVGNTVLQYINTGFQGQYIYIMNLRSVISQQRKRIRPWCAHLTNHTTTALMHDHTTTWPVAFSKTLHYPLHTSSCLKVRPNARNNVFSCFCCAKSTKFRISSHLPNRSRW